MMEDGQPLDQSALRAQGNHLDGRELIELGLVHRARPDRPGGGVRPDGPELGRFGSTADPHLQEHTGSRATEVRIEGGVEEPLAPMDAAIGVTLLSRLDSRVGSGPAR